MATEPNNGHRNIGIERDKRGRFVKGHKCLTRIWTYQEEELLKQLYPIKTLEELKEIFVNKTAKQIRCKARALKLKKTEEAKRRAISQALKGKPRPYMSGRKLSEEHKAKISAGLRRFYSTHDGPWKGKKKPEWIKRKLREKMKGKVNVGDSNPAKRPEVRRKIAETLRKGASSFYRFKDHPEWRRRNLKACLKRPANTEKKLIDIIEKYDLPFKYVGDGEVIIGTLNPDFIHNNGEKKVIEVFGRTFHDPEVSFKDEIPWYQQYWGRMAYYAQFGYGCLIIWDDEINDEKTVVRKIKSFLERRLE